MNPPFPPKPQGTRGLGNVLFGCAVGGLAWYWSQGTVWEWMLQQLGLGHLQATENLPRSLHLVSPFQLSESRSILPLHPEWDSMGSLGSPALIGTHLAFWALLTTRTV